MKSELKKLPGSQMEITVELTTEELQPYLIESAEHLSEHSPIAGFRPGKVPFEVAKKQFGEMKILEHAADHVISHTFFALIKENKLLTVGAPQINVEKMAPGNALIYKAVVALLPNIKLAGWKKHNISRKEIKITDDKIDKVIEDARKMQAKEVIADRPAGKEDKVVVDMDILLDKVPVEGGQSKNHAIYLNETHYIPGLPEQLVGLKKDETKEFTLPFPQEHYQKHLAGKNADFKITIKDIFERTLPEINDDLAKNLGQPDLAGLKKVINENLTMEATQKEEQRLEIELIEKLVKESQFDELPELLITEEKHKMFAELKGRLAEQQIPFEDYLKNLNKTEEELAKEFTHGATERVKTALILREIAKEENITVDPKETEDEIQRLRETYKDNQHLEERLASLDILDYINATILNRKIMKMLKDAIIK